MPFYSGFSLKDESHFFNKYLKTGKYCVSGFSYGAIKAIEYVLVSKQRIDTLQLFSPVFFQDKSEKFKHLQLISYDKKGYIENFLYNCFAPYKIKKTLHVQNTKIQLNELLYYRYNISELKSINKRGVNIEIYLGSDDKIINTDMVKKFFLPFATIYLIKNANHFLQTN